MALKKKKKVQPKPKVIAIKARNAFSAISYGDYTLEDDSTDGTLYVLFLPCGSEVAVGTIQQLREGVEALNKIVAALPEGTK